MTNQVISALKGTARVIADTYRLGFKAWIAAPAIVAIAVLPQLAQHAFEIRRGMFGSLEQFQFLANGPSHRMLIYLKIAGMVIAMLAIARFWAVGSLRKVFVMSRSDLARLGLAIALLVAVTLAFDQLEGRYLPPLVASILRVVSLLAKAAAALFVAAALFGDWALTLRAVVTDRWPTILLLGLALLVAFVPSQMLQMLNYRLAFGRPTGTVVALMVWDAVVVGLIASLAGSALWAAYRTGATWRGWGPGYMPEPAVQVAEEVAEVETKADQAAILVVAPPPPPPPLAQLPPAPPPPASPSAAPSAAAEPAAEAPPPRRRRPRPGPRPRG